jgi:hypothetical protein
MAVHTWHSTHKPASEKLASPRHPVMRPARQEQLLTSQLHEVARQPYATTAEQQNIGRLKRLDCRHVTDTLRRRAHAG